MVEFTGERIVPGKVDADLYNEHVSRYHFASTLAHERHCLDAGCGLGYGTHLLATNALSATGVDIHIDTALSARECNPLTRATYSAADVSALPFGDQTFGLTVSFEVIEHLSNWRDFVREIARVTAATGIALISTPNRDYYAESRGESGPNPFHQHEFSFAEFQAALEEVFPFVVLFGQNIVPAISFFNSTSNGLSSGHAPDSPREVAEAQFYVAVCSASPLPAIQDFTYVTSTGNVLMERARHIHLLEDELQLKARWLEEARSSLEALHEAHRLLEEEHRERSAWALTATTDLEARNRELAATLDAKCAELSKTVDLLHQAETTVAERSAWAKGLDDHNQTLRARIAQLETSLHAVSETLASSIAKSESLTDQVEALFTALDDNQHLRYREMNLLAEILGLNDNAEALTITDIANHVRAHIGRSEERAALIDAVATSRWLRIGRLLGVGPNLGQPSS